ncbi:NirD/YgiW/YdeI family stress tolerance protein [Campylobacter concisus]|uniref:NirD/YgiW/YdeI family stress tolerance protein n=1 Tax=Campylobacter concisus TaxID=199 RepID=UPI000CD9278D|nr:NirD/YgiW/YdeI family stress tolerance protein [Campylobacter concisus]
MKKIIIAAISASIAMAGGFTSKHSSETISVKEVLKLNDDTKVVLEGKIKSHIKSDKYEFIDKNGDVIVVEIDKNKWGNITVNEDIPLRIRGEIDKDLMKTEIDVDSVEIIR